jgi:PadR family transcriptional regulator PadR
LLAVVEDEPAYGYEMTTRLRDRGLDTVADGSIYPALARLERDRLMDSYRVPSEGGPPRKYYKITAAGQELLSDNRKQWTAFASGVAHVLRLGEGSDEQGH